MRSAAFVKTALQHLRRAAPPSVLADIAIALSVVGDGAAVEFALRMLGEVARDAAARDGAAGVGGDEAEQRRRSFSTAPAGDFGPRAQLARAVLLLRQATIAGQHDSLGARDGKLRDARDALARVSPASLAGMCAATPRLLLEGLAFGSEKDAGEGGSGRTVDACAPFVRHLWNYSPVALVAALVAIVQQPRGAMGALGLVELSALDALALLRAVARGGDVDSGSMSSVRHQKNPGDAGSASISESDASAAESALHPAIIIFMERIADASSALSCTARGALALILAQHYMRCLATPPRGAAPRWSAPRWYTDSLPPSVAECPTWLARLALPEARAERNRSADTSDEMFSKLAVLVSTDARAASLEASVASAVLATANNFEHRSALRVLCMAELGDLDGSLHALLTIVRALRQRARTSILNDDALRDTCIAFVNERCSTLAHWRSVSAALFVAIVTAEREAKGAAHGEFCRGLYTTVLGQLVSNLSFASFASLLPENVRPPCPCCAALRVHALTPAVGLGWASCTLKTLTDTPPTTRMRALCTFFFSTGESRVLPALSRAKRCAQRFRALPPGPPIERSLAGRVSASFDFSTATSRLEVLLQLYCFFLGTTCTWRSRERLRRSSDRATAAVVPCVPHWSNATAHYVALYEYSVVV